MPRPSRAFSKPWRLIEHPESLEIVDAAETHLAFVYFEDELSRRQTLRRLSKDEARRLADQALTSADREGHRSWRGVIRPRRGAL